jgi:predicted ester cyclase
MKKTILLFSLIFFSSCNQSGSRIEVSDDKSKIIQKIFDEVAAERIDYLEDVFSSEMKMVNSKNEEFNKNQFIIGIKDMLDLFDDISFDNVNADADGSEIETNYYSNGNVWSSIWNNFSATGKYTGQKVNFPFHISYKWKGDKIIEEYQFFDLMAFEKEANARASQNGTNEKVGFVIELSINKGSNVEEVKTLLKQLTEFMRTNEQEAYDYGYYISEDGKRITLIEKYLNSQAAILHADNFEGGSNMKPFMDSFTIESFVLIGNSSKALQDRIKAYGVKPRKLIGGWTN